MEKQTKTLALGAEWDQALRARLLTVLGEMGAEFNHRWELGGSQEIDTMEVSLEGRRLVVECETYIGLTLTGPSDLVERIQSRLASA